MTCRTSMVIYFIALFLLSFVGISKAQKGEWFDPLDKRQTSAINGISVLLVFICHILHALQYHSYAWTGFGDRSFLLLRGYVQQLLVVSFLFYSGYGVMTQMLRKGDGYIRSFPMRRVLSLYLNFVFAVCIYALIHLAFNNGISVSRIVASFTCWQEIGTPSWYVFCILWCYLSHWICAEFRRMMGLNADYIALGVLAMSFVYIAILCATRPTMNWWYNTILAYPAGVVLALKHDVAIGFARKNWSLWFSLSVVVFFLLYRLPYEYFGLKHNVMGCVMMSGVILLTMRFRIGNRFLDWCGRHVFPMYMYHFAVYLIIGSFCKGKVTPATAQAIVFCAFASTLAISFLYPKFEISISGRFRRREF